MSQQTSLILLPNLRELTHKMTDTITITDHETFDAEIKYHCIPIILPEEEPEPVFVEYDDDIMDERLSRKTTINDLNKRELALNEI